MKVNETHELSPVTIDFLHMLLVREEGKQIPTWRDVVKHSYTKVIFADEKMEPVKVTTVYDTK